MSWWRDWTAASHHPPTHPPRYALQCAWKNLQQTERSVLHLRRKRENHDDTDASSISRTSRRRRWRRQQQQQLHVVYIHALQHEMQHLVRTLNNYFASQVLSGSWHTLMKRIDMAKNVDALLAHHGDYIKSIALHCFILPELAAVRSCLGRCLDQVFAFSALLATNNDGKTTTTTTTFSPPPPQPVSSSSSSSSSFTSPSSSRFDLDLDSPRPLSSAIRGEGVVLERVHNIGKRFRKHVAQFLFSLKHAVLKHGAELIQLEALYERLNFNGFYAYACSS